MAKLIYVANVSLDGYIEDAQGSLDWAAPTDEVITFITDLVRPVGTYLYGRRMYETMAVWESQPALAAQSELRPTSRTSGKQPTRSSTPRRCPLSRPPTRGSSAASTPMRSAT
jgi:dihydrofolate reductase